MRDGISASRKRANGDHWAMTPEKHTLRQLCGEKQRQRQPQWRRQYRVRKETGFYLICFVLSLQLEIPLFKTHLGFYLESPFFDSPTNSEEN